ncbi:ABC transporter substrate-binding protein [Planctomonas sp. JC2975]|uniref:extracellular solute-binding protein n=1 Tax=Planctomonas sp. JC2975 TaxID=2729626 RepID=UPI0014737A0A|nr:extracellular solute-binding protein [Planctomonas sp. JC2975]NNC13862.1 ABC transporter substrate-binding protein [Planctomonas sp. JC2975]
MKRREFLALAGIGAVATMTLSSCSLIDGSSSASAGSSGAFPSSWKDEITIDVFDDLANYQGIATGWFAKLVKDKFNMKLNMIAPNVAGGGDTLFNTRSAAGDLGDLVLLGSSAHLPQALKGGLLLDASPYYKNMGNVQKYDAAVKNVNKGQKGTFGFPTTVSSLKPTVSSEATDPLSAPFLRWDLYAQLGYPEINNLDDLLDVLQKMQHLQPKAPNGKPVYAFSFFKDWDSFVMQNATQFQGYYGYTQAGLVFAAADGSDYQSVLDSDGYYVQSLRLYAKASRMGLVDPDSPTQNYSALFTKFQNGEVLFSWWPWLGGSAYNTDANMKAGKGFQMAPLKNMKVYSAGVQPYGGSTSFAIGAKAKDPQRVAAFIDWLYSPEGVYANSGGVLATPGPEGMTWTNSSGKPDLNPFGQKTLLDGGTDTVSASYGGGTFSKGVSPINVVTVDLVDKDPATGQPFTYMVWPSYQALVENPLTKDWSAKMAGQKTTMAYLQKKGELVVAPGSGYIAPTDSSEISTLRGQLGTVIVSNSWKMAMSTSEAEFNALLKDMQTTANGLGYDKVYKVDLANAKAQAAAQKAIVKKFG